MDFSWGGLFILSFGQEKKRWTLYNKLLFNFNFSFSRMQVEDTLSLGV